MEASGQLAVLLFSFSIFTGSHCSPLVINTWGFSEAAQTAWDTVSRNGSALDSVELGVATCERNQCDGSVGWGNHPDENGETTLDALIMDGPTHDAGSVGGIRRVKSAISVARKVLEHTRVTLLVAEQATDFAKSMGFPVESLTSNQSATEHRDWLKNGCQPNYWVKVKPDPSRFCGPYQSADSVSVQRHRDISDKNHDTIGMVVIDRKGWMAVGTSTNGLDHKIAGRVGDSPIIGSGAYVDQQHGAAAATGDGDVMMRFLPSYQAVESLRQGMTPDQAAKDAMRRIAARAPDFQGAIVVATSDGHYSAACHGLGSFPYSVANDQTGKAVVKTVPCISTY